MGLNIAFINSVLRPLLWVANVPCKSLLSAALFIWSYRFEPVNSLRSSNHVRPGLPLPRLTSSLPSIVLRRVSQCPDVFLIIQHSVNIYRIGNPLAKFCLCVPSSSWLCDFHDQYTVWCILLNSTQSHVILSSSNNLFLLLKSSCEVMQSIVLLRYWACNIHLSQQSGAIML